MTISVTPFVSRLFLSIPDVLSETVNDAMLKNNQFLHDEDRCLYFMMVGFKDLVC